MYQEITKCRVCKNPNLIEILSLGDQALSGVFPSSVNEFVPSGPLILVKCNDEENSSHCGLVQLKHSFNLLDLYGQNYGYRSGLNISMVNHLHQKINKILKIGNLQNNDIVIDIGSNDATALKAYPVHQYKLIGIDPTGKKFQDFYPPHIQLLPDFFSTEKLKPLIAEKKAKIITSFSMFYDLENPLQFMQEVFDILADDGIWCFEQSYLLSMLNMNSFDTICHEHLEYYHLKPILWMCDLVGFKIIDIEFNKINGGSISIIVSKKNSIYPSCDAMINSIIQNEMQENLNKITPFFEFSERIIKIRKSIQEFFGEIKNRNEIVYGLGASTKGNVILQYCDINTDDMPFIGEVNQDKIGKYTPKTLIPIIQESEIVKKSPNYLFILPWHFTDFFKNRKNSFNAKLLFPLPLLEVV